MSALLGHLTSPSRMPFHAMAFFGFSATLDWRWLVTILLMSFFVPITLGIGRLSATRSFMKRALNSYLSSHRYDCVEITLRDPGLAERFGFLEKGSFNSDSAERNKKLVRLFMVRGRDRMARLSTISQCFRGGTSQPAVVFLRMLPEHFSETQLFELLHEFGHASEYSDEVEALRFVEPIFIGMSALAFLVVTGWSDIAYPIAAIYCFNRLVYWYGTRLELEPEVIADAFALKCEPSTEVARVASASIRAHLQRLASDASRPRSEREAANKRRLMLEGNLRLHAADRLLIATHAVNYNWLVNALSIVFATAHQFGEPAE